MLSLGKLAPGQQQYYLDTVARGAEEYYTGAREAPGRWTGASAPRVGVSGEVDGVQLGRLLDHVDPESGTYRLTGSRSVPVVAGFDATFCAPKSVSLLFALGSGEVSNEVRSAHDAAQTAAFGVLEQAACRVRRGKGGHTVLDADGFVAAAFRHRTSRAADPHLHTHVVIANLAHAPTDDRWTALDARPLYAWLAPVGHLYEAQLRWELTRRLGVEWTPVHHGIADVAGVPRAVLREFSTRRREIEAHLDEHGHHSARAAQLATYATRAAKDPNLDASDLVAGWQDRAAANGFDPASLDAVLGRTAAVEPPRPGTREAEALYRWLASPDGLTRQASTFGEREVLKAICDAVPGGGQVNDILDLADGFLRSDHVLTLATDEGATIRLGDGRRIGAQTGEQHWTTPEMLATEARVIDTAIAYRGCGWGVAEPSAIDAATTCRPTLSDEQAEMVRSVCGSGDGIELVEGVAGSGKTYALASAREAWEASGYRVIGCALAARAAKQLQDGAGIHASTLDRLLGDLTRHSLPPRTVIVVDEAAMVGTRRLAQLLDHAQAVQAKVVLVGDPCQLPEIDAGGAFRGLRARLGATVLDHNRRQTSPWERDALAELRAGNVDDALDTYQAHDRIHTAATDNDTRQLLIEDWYDAHLAGDDVLMVAARLTDVGDLNSRARQRLQETGRLGPDQLQVGTRFFCEGDQVLALRNQYRDGLLNGMRGVIEHIDSRRHQVTVITDDHQRRQIPLDYLAAGHLTHGYATTIHKAQGATVDRCLILADDTTSREHGYTALSRGRHHNDLYTTSPDRRFEERHAHEVEPDPTDSLRTALTHTGGKHLALDHTPTSEPTLDDLIARRQQLADEIGPVPSPLPYDIERLVDDKDHAERTLIETRQQLDQVHDHLEQLGPLARLTHRTQRQGLQDQLTALTGKLQNTQTNLDQLDERYARVAPRVEARTTWEAHHATQLEQLDDLDHQINLTHQVDARIQPATERSHGLDLGL